MTSPFDLNLDARGKPSTMFPRGRLVETERTPTYKALFDKWTTFAELSPCHTQITEPYAEQSNFRKYPCQKIIPFDKTYSIARHGALAQDTSSGICTGPVDRHTSIQSLQTLSLGPCRARAIFSSASAIVPDLRASRSLSVEFSWTSRSQNLKI